MTLLGNGILHKKRFFTVSQFFSDFYWRLLHRAIFRAIKSSFRTPVLVRRPPVAGKVEISERVAGRQRLFTPLHVVAHVDEDQVAAIEVTPESRSLLSTGGINWLLTGFVRYEFLVFHCRAKSVWADGNLAKMQLSIQCRR